MKSPSPFPLSTGQRVGVAAFTLLAVPLLASLACIGFWLTACGGDGWILGVIVLFGVGVLAPAASATAWAVGLAAMFAWHLHRLRRHGRFSVLFSDAAIISVVLFVGGAMLGAVLGKSMRCSLF